MVKVKLLLVGSVGQHVDDLVERLTSLQKSKAGPFDACFCVGPSSRSIKDHGMPLPVYIQDCSRLIGDGTTESNQPEGIRKLNENLYLLQGCTDTHIANIWRLPIGNTELIVASLPVHFRLESDLTQSIQEKLSHVSYVGCDLFLTSEFPQGIEDLLPKDLRQQGSFDVADIALRVRARYHIAPNVGFTQSSPFMHLPSSSSTFTPKHVGRFISLAPVVGQNEAKEKGKLGKYIHALGMTPLHYLTTDELEKKVENLLPCPYTDESYQIQPEGFSRPEGFTGLSEAQARRIMSQDIQPDYRWSNKRREAPSERDQEVDETITTLFLHGLHKDVSGQLQLGTAAIMKAFKKFGISSVRKPPTASSYAFLEFPSHPLARKCLEETNGEININGVHLTLKWGSHASRSGSQTKKMRLTEAEAVNSSTVYFRLAQNVLSNEVASACENLRKMMEHVLENALGDPDISAATEPALMVTLRVPDATKGYGFLDFASHAAASMALASQTGSTDGGQMIDDNERDVKIPELLLGAILYWAPEKKKGDSELIETASGIQFQRQHFPADSRTDCWFCLASPTCEKHLITSVHNQCYIAMPKGPVHKEGHVLIVPVTHTSQGALSDASVASEIDDLKGKLRQHASDVWDMDLFVFERAMQTKGGYHTHVQCVPVPKNLGTKLEATLVGMARLSGFNLKELNSDVGLAGMSERGYFYAEIPFSKSEPKRFLYRAVDGASVPLQFGREVLASVLDNPDLAHWKACVLNEQEEISLAAKFRESFSKYEA